MFFFREIREGPCHRISFSYSTTKMFSINKNLKNKFLLWPFIKPSSFFPSHVLLNLIFASILNIMFFADCPNKKSTRWLSTLCILIFKTKFCKRHVSFVYTRVRLFLNLNASNYTTPPRNFGYIGFFCPIIVYGSSHFPFKQFILPNVEVAFTSLHFLLLITKIFERGIDFDSLIQISNK